MIAELVPPEWRDRITGGVVDAALACFAAALITWCEPDPPPAPAWRTNETPAAPNESTGVSPAKRVED